jgi:hypothetical protein
MHCRDKVAASGSGQPVIGAIDCAVGFRFEAEVDHVSDGCEVNLRNRHLALLVLGIIASDPQSRSQRGTGKEKSKDYGKPRRATRKTLPQHSPPIC